MRGHLLRSLFAVVLSVLLSYFCLADAADSVPFYHGKIIHLIISTSADMGAARLCDFHHATRSRKKPPPARNDADSL
jgi:hypothetical protein